MKSLGKNMNLLTKFDLWSDTEKNRKLNKVTIFKDE
jgi:hypothetical protein